MLRNYDARQPAFASEPWWQESERYYNRSVNSCSGQHYCWLLRLAGLLRLAEEC